METDPFDQIREAAASGRRSTLYRWMMRNHDQFAETLDEAGRPNWEEVALTFTAMNLTNRDVDKPLTAASVRLTWRKVRASRARQPIKRPASSLAAPVFPAVTLIDTTSFDNADAGEFKFHDLKGDPI